MIKIHSLSIAYKDLEITYQDREFTTNTITFIKGSNGSGKTSLLKSIGGLIPYKGTIESQGFVTFNSQSPVLFNMSVYDNIVYPLKIRKLDVSRYQNKIEEYVSLFKLDHILHKKATLCSSGEQMKTSIIRSIIFQPSVLLLDEPTTSLDIESIQALTNLLKDIKKDMTILISSHDRLFIEELKDSIYQLGDTHV